MEVDDHCAVTTVFYVILMTKALILDCPGSGATADKLQEEKSKSYVDWEKGREQRGCGLPRQCVALRPWSGAAEGDRPARL